MNSNFTRFKSTIKDFINDPKKNWINIIFFLFILLSTMFILIYLPYGKKFICLSNTQIFYFFSAGAQSIAGLFGLSIAGYAFFNNYLVKEIEKENELETIVKDIKKKYYKTIILMSIFAFFAITLSILIINLAEKNTLFIKYLMNFSGIAVVGEIFIIICFACAILHPDLIYKYSLKIKIHEDEAQPPGDFAKFTQFFNEIFSYMHNFIMELRGRKEYKGIDIRKNASNNQKAFFFYNNEIIDNRLFEDLLDLIRYRNYTTHSLKINVSKEMEKKADDIDKRIIAAIDKFRRNLES